MGSISSETVESYDIFKKLADGTAVWVCEVTSVLEARARLRDLERDDPADYYVCNLADRMVLGKATPSWPELHAGNDDPSFFHVRRKGKFMEPQTSALIINEDRSMLQGLQAILQQQNVETRCALNFSDGRALFASDALSEIIFTGTSFSDGTWRDVLAMAQATDPPSAVVLVTRLDEIGMYLDAMAEGACDYIVPPFAEADVAHIVRSALRDLALHRRGPFFAGAA
jgi:ActR/RegA family two-component response regulator